VTNKTRQKRADACNTKIFSNKKMLKN